MGRYDNVGLTRADLTPPEDRLTTGIIIDDDALGRCENCDKYFEDEELEYVDGHGVICKKCKLLL